MIEEKSVKDHQHKSVCESLQESILTKNPLKVITPLADVEFHRYLP